MVELLEPIFKKEKNRTKSDCIAMLQFDLLNNIGKKSQALFLITILHFLLYLEYSITTYFNYLEHNNYVKCSNRYRWCL
jgi:hypothetical protein